MKNIIEVKLPKKPKTYYPIYIGNSIYDFDLWLPKVKFSKIVIITDNLVKKKYGLKLCKQLKKSDISVLLISFPAGEKYKNHETKQKLELLMLKHHCDRKTLILALGGGVVGDVAGFIAATYLRGVPYIQIPTTLLAMVDSSIGGKTSINTVHGKNLIGAFHQPICIVTDINFLKTIPKPHIINGLIEAIKIFITSDKNSFNFCLKNLKQFFSGNSHILKEMITRAITLKARIVEQDEREESDQRCILNFGHTIGHAIEKVTQYKILHGHAVAYGILVEAHISHLLGYLEPKSLLKIKSLLSMLGFHGDFLKKFNNKSLINATKNDKKVRSGQVRYVIVNGIGSIYTKENRYIHPVSDRIIDKALKNLIAV